MKDPVGFFWMMSGFGVLGLCMFGGVPFLWMVGIAIVDWKDRPRQPAGEHDEP